MDYSVIEEEVKKWKPRLEEMVKKAKAQGRSSINRVEFWDFLPKKYWKEWELLSLNQHIVIKRIFGREYSSTAGLNSLYL